MWFIVCLCWAVPVSAVEEEDQPFSIHFRVSQTTKQTGKPPTVDHHDHAAPTYTPSETYRLQQNVKTVLGERLAKSNGKLTQQDVAAVYQAAEHFSIIHGMLGTDIDPAVSAQLGRGRQQLHEQALKTAMQDVRQRTGKLGVNDFGSGADMSKVNAKTDIDFTLYPETDSVDGRILIDAYNKAFKKLAGVDPGQMDIVAHRYEATIPDWRQSHSVGDFLVKIRQGRDLLRKNPEAYFLEGAYVQQIMGRSTKEGARTFRWIEMGDGGPRFGPARNAALERQFFYTPEIKARFALGGAVGNRLFWHGHKGDMAAQAKYLLRSMDDGVDLVLSPEEKRRYKPWDTSDLPAQIRRDLVERLYGHYPEHVRNELWMALETARIVRKLKDAKKAITPQTAMDETYLRYHRKLMGEVQFRDEQQLIDQARRSYQRASKLILVENVARSAQPRLKDWLAPDIHEKVPAFNPETGRYEKVAPTRDQITKLQFTAFYELRDVIDVMEPETIARIKRQNPDASNEISLLERLVKKQREMMLQTEPAKELDLMQRRRKAAEDVVDAFEKLSGGKKSTRVLGTIQDGWAAGQALETYMQGCMVDALVDIGGPKYGMMLENMRLQANPVNAQILSPVWMGRIGKANSVINVLTAYTRKGKVDSEVAYLALREGVSYIPVVGMALDVKTGGTTAVGQIVLTQTIPGYAPVLLAVNTATGVVRLGGEAVFAPLKRDKIILAYQGYLPKKSGGLFSTGRKERIWLPRKGLLYWVDPQGKLKMDERRKRFFHWFRPRLAKAFTRKWGETPEEYLKDTSSPNESRIWAAEEGRYLQMYVRKYIHDWWEGTGEFSVDADVVLHSMMADHFSDEIKAELERMLISDYLTGKQLYVQDLEKGNAGLQKTISRAAYTHNRMEENYRAEDAAFREAMRTAGEAVTGRVLAQAPTIENGLALLAAPHVVETKGEDGQPAYKIDSVNLRAKVTAPSTEAHPAPFTVRFEVQAGEKAETDDRQQRTVKIQSEADRIVVVAKVYDANNQLYFQDDIGFDVVKEKLAADMDEERLASLLEELQNLALQIESSAAVVRRHCREAEALLGVVRASIAEIQSAADEMKAGARDLEPEVRERGRLSLDVPGQHRQAETATTGAGELAVRMEKISEKVCRYAQQLRKQGAGNAASKQALLKKLDDLGRQLRQLLTRVDGKVADVDRTARTAVADVAAMEAQEARFGVLRNAEDLSAMVDSQGSNLDSALEHCSEAEAALRDVHQLQGQFNESLAAAQTLVDRLEDREKKDAHAKTLKDLEDQVRLAVSDVMDCPGRARGQVETLRRQVADIREPAREADTARKSLLAKKGMGPDAVKEAAEKAELCDFLHDMVQGYAARAQKLAEDGVFCTALAQNLIEKPPTVAVPELVGLELDKAKRLLAARGLKLRTQKAGKAPRPDLGDSVARQEPEAGRQVPGGAVVTLDVYQPWTRQELLSQVDCSKYDNTEPHFDPASGKTTCRCRSGYTLNTQKSGCVDCRTQQAEFQRAAGSGQWRQAEDILAMSANCSFYGRALAQLQDLRQQVQNSACNRLRQQYWQAMNSKNYRGAQQVLDQARSCDFHQRFSELLQSSLRHEREMYCLEFESRILRSLSQNNLKGAQQLVNQAAQNGCTISQRTLSSVQRAANSQRRQQQVRQWTALINGLAQIVRNSNQGGGRRPAYTPPANRPGGGGNSGGTTGGNSGGSGVDCDKKYCPICGDDDIDMLGQSTDAQCMECRRKNKARIEACLKGKDSGAGNTYDSFRTYSIYQCKHRYWDAVQKRHRYSYSYHITGGRYARPSGACSVVYSNKTETECYFEKQRLEAIEKKRTNR